MDFLRNVKLGDVSVLTVYAFGALLKDIDNHSEIERERNLLGEDSEKYSLKYRIENIFFSRLEEEMKKNAEAIKNFAMGFLSKLPQSLLDCEKKYIKILMKYFPKYYAKYDVSSILIDFYPWQRD